MQTQDPLHRIKSLITSHPNFPTQGVTFRDIHPVMTDSESRDTILDILVKRYSGKIDRVVGLESRGYYFGIPLAFALKIPFVPVRKPGKLPGKTFIMEYQLEYKEKEALEVQEEMIPRGCKVVVMDDLIATGGTAGAACKLVEMCGGIVYECSFLIELKDLKGREKLPPSVPFFSLLSY